MRAEKKLGTTAEVHGRRVCRRGAYDVGVHRNFISLVASAMLLGCPSAPPPPQTPADLAIEPTDIYESAPVPPPAPDDPEPEQPAKEETQRPSGNVWGAVGESFGAGGLGLHGTGQAGGGTGVGPHGRVVSGRRVGLGGSGYRNEINRVIREHSPQVRSCYEQSLKRDGASTGGRLVLEFTIAPDGSVASAKANPGITPPLDACVVGVIRGAQFPAPPKGQPTMVSYPFILKSS